MHPCLTPASMLKALNTVLFYRISKPVKNPEIRHSFLTSIMVKKTEKIVF